MNLAADSLCDSVAGDSIARSISGVILFHGYRVVAHDRRGHGRSNQADTGTDMDTYAADVATLVQALDLRDAIHIRHSTGGGEVARYVAHSAQGDQNAPVRSRFALLKLVGWVSNQAVGVEELFGGFRREDQT